MKKKKEQINIQLDTIDWIFEILGLFSILFLIFLPLFYFSSLPETIPTHFGWEGNPNDYGEKMMIWILPIIGVILYVSMIFLNQFIKTYYDPRAASIKEAEYQAMQSSKLIRILNSLISAAFAYITWISIQVALQQSEGLGGLFIPAFISLVFAVVIYFLFKLTKKPSC